MTERLQVGNLLAVPILQRRVDFGMNRDIENSVKGERRRKRDETITLSPPCAMGLGS
jgi:hypothetical protein